MPPLHNTQGGDPYGEAISIDTASADTNTQSLFDPDAQGSTILGITFFGVVPITACIAYLVVKIYKLQKRKKHERLAVTYESSRRRTIKQPEQDFQGKPELSTETAKYEVNGEDPTYEMDGNETGHEMDAEGTQGATQGIKVIAELQAERDTFEISPRTRQELKGEEFSRELEVPNHQFHDDASKRAMHESLSIEADRFLARR